MIKIGILRYGKDILADATTAARNLHEFEEAVNAGSRVAIGFIDDVHPEMYEPGLKALAALIALEGEEGSIRDALEYLFSRVYAEAEVNTRAQVFEMMKEFGQVIVASLGIPAKPDAHTRPAPAPTLPDGGSPLNE